LPTHPLMATLQIVAPRGFSMRICAALLVALALTGHHATGQEENRKEERTRVLLREEVVAAEIVQLKQAIAEEAAAWQAKVKQREARVATMKKRLADSEAAARKIRDEIATGGKPSQKKEDGYAEIRRQLEEIRDRVKALEKQKKP
jgi:chromosome segregation ATPase